MEDSVSANASDDGIVGVFKWLRGEREHRRMSAVVVIKGTGHLHSRFLPSTYLGKVGK